MLPDSTPAFALPSGYSRVRIVSSFPELLATPLAAGVNALCWPRNLPGDFRAVVDALGAGEGIESLDEARLMALSLSGAGGVARDFLLDDQRLLRAHGLAPELSCIHGYPRDEEAGAVPVDVYSFHADSAPVAAETWLCSYTEPVTEGLRNDEAQRRIDLPETRARLRREFGGEDNEDFRAYLAEHCYDLHYAPLPHARPFSFGLGNLWRVAIEYPGCPVPPCLHRAPETRAGEPARLLLIS